LRRLFSSNFDLLELAIIHFPSVVLGFRRQCQALFKSLDIMTEGHHYVTMSSIFRSFAINRCSGLFLQQIRRPALLGVIFGLAVVLPTGCSSTGEDLKAGLIAPAAEDRPYDPAEPGFDPTTVSRYATDDLRALGLYSPESSHWWMHKVFEMLKPGGMVVCREPI
jgi:hypothetical protein